MCGAALWGTAMLQTASEIFRLLGYHTQTIITSALIGVILVSSYALLVAVRRNREEYRNASATRQRIADQVGPIADKIASKNAPRNDSHVVEALANIVKAEGRRSARWSLIQNLVFFILGTITSIYVPWYFQ
jgi:hypothetical protein